MLGRLRMSVDDCIKEYTDLAGVVFGNPRTFSIRGPALWPREKYNHQRLKNAIIQVVEKHDLSDINAPEGQRLASDEDKCKTYVLSSKYFRI